MLEKKAIFYSKYYQVAFSGGSVSFEWSSEPEVEIIETVPEPVAEETESWGTESNDDWGSDDGWGESENDSWGDEPDNSENVEEVPVNSVAAYSEPMPILEGPIVKLKNINLKFLVSTDSVKLNNVSGSMELIGSTFVAEGGKLTWEHLGIPVKDLYADLSEFTFEVNKKEFYAEQSTLYYPEIIKRPVKGIVEFKAENVNRNGSSNYPYFQSYESDYDLNFIDKKWLVR